MTQTWVRKSVWTTILGWLAVGMVAGGLAYLFLPSQYESSVTAYAVPSSEAGNAAEQYQASLLIKDRMTGYADIARSPAVLDDVIDKLGLTSSAGELADRVTVTIPDETSLLVFTALDSDPVRSQELAAAVAGAAIERLTQIESGDGESSLVNFRWVSPASYPAVPAVPNGPVTVGLGAAGGLLIGVGFAVIPLLRATCFTQGRVHIVVVGPMADRLRRAEPTTDALRRPAHLEIESSAADSVPMNGRPIVDSADGAMSGVARG